MTNLPSVIWDNMPNHLCIYCRQRFYYNTSRYLIHLRRHEQWTHPYRYGSFQQAVVKRTRCVSTWNSSFRTILEITSHKDEMVLTNYGQYQCQYCLKCFTSANGRKVHERLHIKGKLYHCKYCKKCFSHASNMTRHERIHTKEKPYQCKYCKKRFPHASSKAAHERIHTKEKP